MTSKNILDLFFGAESNDSSSSPKDYDNNFSDVETDSVYDDVSIKTENDINTVAAIPKTGENKHIELSERCHVDNSRILNSKGKIGEEKTGNKTLGDVQDAGSTDQQTSSNVNVMNANIEPGGDFNWIGFSNASYKGKDYVFMTEGEANTVGQVNTENNIKSKAGVMSTSNTRRQEQHDKGLRPTGDGTNSYIRNHQHDEESRQTDRTQARASSPTEVNSEQQIDKESNPPTGKRKANQPKPKDGSNTWVLTDEDLRSFKIWRAKRLTNKEGKPVTEKPQGANTVQQKGLSKLQKTGKGRFYSKYKRLVFITPLTVLSQMAKSYGGDVDKLEEMAKTRGMGSFYLPCMQCNEEYGLGMVKSDYTDDPYSDPFDTAPSDRCRRCGGQKIALTTMIKTISEFRQVVADKNLVIHDVSPDGNCQFAAIVDQLRVRGDFRYNIDELRQAAVNYLRENPVSSDGTLYEHFMTTETWPEFLDRMSQDGEWGDHFVLTAMANILQRKIVILGGNTKHHETKIVPKFFKDTDPNNTLYIGHLGEMHYMSLRPKHWGSGFQEGTEDNSAEDESGRLNQPFPVRHVDFLLNQIFATGYVAPVPFPKDCISVMSKSNMRIEIVGSMYTKMAAREHKSVRGTDLGLFSKETNGSDPIFLHLPLDSRVWEHKELAGRMDLVADGPMTSIFHLTPVRSKSWKGQTTGVGQEQHLMWLDIDKPSEKEDPSPVCIGFPSEWPKIATEWIERERRNDFPKPDIVKSIIAIGCQIVPATPVLKHSELLSTYVPPGTGENKDTWDISFTIAERELSDSLSLDQRACFLLFKCLVDMTLQKHTLPNIIVTSVFFYACENIKREEWKCRPGQCFLILLKKITNGFQANYIPHYFIAGKNILHGIPAATIKSVTKSFTSQLASPLISIYQALDKLGITTSEFSCFIDTVISDMSSEDCCDSEASLYETFLPVCGHLIQTFVENGKCSVAFSALIALQAHFCESLGIEKTVESVAGPILELINLRNRWCFALFIDISLSTTLTQSALKGIATVHISDVFGPEATTLVRDTCIPEEALVEYGDIRYPKYFAETMQELGNTAAIVTCLQYYIRTYGDLAGDGLIVPVVNEDARNEMSALGVYGQKTMTGSTLVKSDSSVYADLVESSGMLPLVHDIYIVLFNACLGLKRLDEFVEFIPQFRLIVESYNKPTPMRNLRTILQYVEGDGESGEMPTDRLAIIGSVALLGMLSGQK